jgi:hypothetical protein
VAYFHSLPGGNDRVGPDLVAGASFDVRSPKVVHQNPTSVTTTISARVIPITTFLISLTASLSFHPVQFEV